MQNTSQHYSSPYHSQSNVYGDAQYRGHRPSYDYATHNASDAQSGSGEYGLYNVPAHSNTQAATYGAPSGSQDGPRAFKRARLDAQGNATPKRTSSSWQPGTGSQSQYTNQHQFRGLALPLMSPPDRIEDYDVQDRGSHGPQSAHPNGIPADVEQQVRGLAEYNPTNDVRPITSGSAQQVDATSVSQNATSVQTSANSPQLMPPQRGARPGNVLHLACVMCMKKKRKCSKNFPCNECQKFQDDCVPSVRKKGGSGVSKPVQEGDLRNDETEEPTRQGLAPGSEKKLVRDHTDPNRKYLMNLPPVIDGYQEWSNMRTKYNPIPGDLDAIREKFFKLEKPLLLNSQQFADYWPHISNVWARGVGPWWDTNGTQLETWECRNMRRLARHQRIKVSESEGLRKRERKIHLLEATEMCKVRIRIAAHIKHTGNNDDHKKGLGACHCVPEWMFLERMKASADLPHNHTLESLDKYKRTHSMLFLAEQKVTEGGYLYAAVRRWIQNKYSHLTNEVSYLTDHDVANAARRWRVQHMDLELVETIPEFSLEDEQRVKLLELIHTTTADGLRQALTEVCKQLPGAVKIALPYLESAQVDHPESATKDSKILEGDEIAIAFPGPQGHRLNTLFQTITPNQIPGHTLANQNQSPVALAQSSMQQSQPQPPAHQPEIPSVPLHHPISQHQPLPPPPTPAQSQLPPVSPMAPRPQTIYQSVTNRFHVYQPRIEAPSSTPQNGVYSVINGGHRHYLPATGSKIPAQAPDMRPSWAQSDSTESTEAKATATVTPKANFESDERVKRQLEAELRPLPDL